MNQMVAVKMLEKLGCRVDVSADGEEAIEMTSRFPYDVVFMDVQMPIVDGLEATRRIRRRDPRAALQIVAMTANAMDGRSRALSRRRDERLRVEADRARVIARSDGTRESGGLTFQSR